MTDKEDIIKKGKKIYADTMEDVDKGGDRKILVVTDQAKDRCERMFPKKSDAKLCNEGVTEKMAEDLRKEFAKKHPN